MAGTIRQLKENISYIQKELQNLSPQDRAEVFRGEQEFQDFTSALNDVFTIVSKLEKDGQLPDNRQKLINLREDASNLMETLFAEENLSLRSFDDLQTKNAKLLNRSIKSLTQDIYDFHHVLPLRNEFDRIEAGMRGMNNKREATKLDSSAQLQKVMLRAHLTKTAEQKKDVNEMMNLLKSTKSVFVVNSHYFDALENSLKALKKFTDRLPADQTKLNEAQTLTLTTLYNNAYNAANAYINRNENYSVRGNRMNMAIRLREALRPGAAAYKGLQLRTEEAQKKAALDAAVAAKRAAANKRAITMNTLKKEFEKPVNAPHRRNSISVKKQPGKDTLSRSHTFGG